VLKDKIRNIMKDNQHNREELKVEK